MNALQSVPPLTFSSSGFLALMHAAALLAVLANGQPADDCPPLYSRYAADHSYCRPPDPTCEVLERSVSSRDAALILKEHNSRRSKVASGREGKLPPAGNMLQMVWDEELAAVAQGHAEQCQFRHDCGNCRRVQNFGVGQNVAKEWSSASRTVPDPNWPQIIESWYDEVSHFGSNHVDRFVPPSRGPAYGHFSQVVWAESWRIGCGYVLYKKPDAYEKLYVCNYGPAGNTVRKAVYEEGARCSACPVNSCCDKTCGSAAEYSGLCKITDNRKPLYKRRGNYLFYCDFQRNQQDCRRSFEGQGRWSKYRTLSGNYLGVVLKGGEESTMVFSRTVKPRTPKFCFVISYRKGPDRANQEEAHSAKQVFKLVHKYFESSQELPSFGGDAKQRFTRYSTSLGWNAETEVRLVFSVPAGKPSQFFEIESAYATEGICGDQ